MGNSAIIKININNKIYVRDPEETQLGKKIVENSILLIDQLGFEHFTFKKLAQKIQSTEASIYRYFENKHKLLVYLTSWYWSWLEYQIDYQTNNIKKPKERLKIAIRIVSDCFQYDANFSHINEVILHRIVVSESSKSYYTKNVDVENKSGYFESYKSLCGCLVDIIKEIRQDYIYPHALVSTILETAHQQAFFSLHLPTLTEIKVSGENYLEIADYLEHLIFKQISA